MNDQPNSRNELIVDDDLLCFFCEYNLKTLPTSGACPECGHSVATTVNLLPNPTGLRTLNDLRLAANVAAWSLMLLLVGALLLFLPTVRRALDGLLCFLPLAFSVFLLGSFVLGDDASRLLGPTYRPDKRYAIAPLFAIVGAIIVGGWFPSVRLVTLFLFVTYGPICWAMCYVGAIARALQQWKLARWARRCWYLSSAVLFLPLAIVLSELASSVRSTPFTLAGVVGGVAIVIMLSLARILKRATSAAAYQQRHG